MIKNQQYIKLYIKIICLINILKWFYITKWVHTSCVIWSFRMWRPRNFHRTFQWREEVVCLRSLVCISVWDTNTLARALVSFDLLDDRELLIMWTLNSELCICKSTSTNHQPIFCCFTGNFAECKKEGDCGNYLMGRSSKTEN